ncbi:MAG: hypothetical protein WBA13_15025 [Microcoleaceae cyanobacterium]
MNNTILNVNQNEPLVIIGNGPSLKGFDFKRFIGVKTLGMNAAYRYWDEIGWYPSYYCCLDDRLLETHYRQIYELLMEEKVERIFVTAKFLEFYPNLAQSNRVDLLDSFIPYWYENRGKNYGIPQRSSNAFLTDNPKKLTTGSYSVRYCIALGYCKILLLGIDCRYIPVVEGAKQVGDLKMVMEKTPTANPNYFFAGYQQAGDVFQVPNPAVHGGNLHLQSFEALRDDLSKYVPGAEVINCNQQSELYDKQVFSYIDFDLAVTGNRLGAIVVPTTSFELDRIIANFKFWNQPGHVPYLHPPDRPSVYLHFVFNSSVDIKFELEARAAFKQAEWVARCFKDIRFSYCNLRGMQDIYRRSAEGEVSAEGYKSGPNNQFFMIIEKLARDYPYIFYMETDCFPIRPNWLQKLIEIVNSTEAFWIKGSLYRGTSGVDQLYQNHLNGNAIYATGNSDFQRFVREIWKPFLFHTTKYNNRRIAYDCLLPIYFDRADASSKSNNKLIWYQWQNVASRFSYTNFIQNHSGTREAKGESEISVQQILRHYPETYIVHGSHFATEIGLEIQSLKRKKIIDKSIVESDYKANNSFKRLYFIGKHLEGQVKEIEDDTFQLHGNFSNNYIAYIYSGIIQASSTLKGEVDVDLSTQATLVLSLNRHGSTKFEGLICRYPLPSGTHKLEISSHFKESHSGVRIQIAVDDDGNSHDNIIKIKSYSLKQADESLS